MGLQTRPFWTTYITGIGFLWAFGDLTRHRPTVTIPDDHDVYHGNVWGSGEVRQLPGHTDQHLTMVATSNLLSLSTPCIEHRPPIYRTPTIPPPFCRTFLCTTPIWSLVGVSFGIVADRMFKSAPRTLLEDAQVRNGWPSVRDWDAAKDGDHPDAILLGDRQHEFLDDWAKDWGTQTWMKVFLSATLFSNVATIPEEEMNGSIIPGLPIPPAGQIVEGYKKGDGHGFQRLAPNGSEIE